MADNKSLSSTKHEAVNSLRYYLFQCFFETDITLRAEALRILSHTIEFWSNAWLECNSRTPLSPRPPSIARHSSSGSGMSSTPGNLFRRDSSFKMQFEDVFSDGDDIFNGSANMTKGSISATTPRTPDSEDRWPATRGGGRTGGVAADGDCAVSPSEPPGPFGSSDYTFSNKGLGRIETKNPDVIWAWNVVAEETWTVEQMRVHLENFHLWLLRFSIDCPYKDVRKGCKEILKRAERSGAQMLVVPQPGPSAFIPLCDTIGLDYPGKTCARTSQTGKAYGPVDTPSEDEGDCPTFSQMDSFSTGIMIPGSKSSTFGDRSRSRSRGRNSAGNSLGRSSRRPLVSLVSTIFQTPPSPQIGLSSPIKGKRRGNVRRPTTKFFPKPRVPCEFVRNLQLNTYNRTGRVGQMNKVLFCFPRFAEACRQATDLLLSSESVDGPLPQTWRIYLGIIAAAEKHCQYYISILSEKFLTVHGKKDWLKGIEYTPLKLQRIAKLNMSLAHLPWTITAADILRLVRVDDLELRWTIAEVLQAILVLTFYHGKSAVALSWGILPEPDLLGGTVKYSTPIAPFGSFPQSTNTDPQVEMTPSLRATSDLDSSGFSSASKGFANLMGRKRESQLGQDLAAEKISEKWKKSSTGGVPYSSTLGSPARTNIPLVSGEKNHPVESDATRRKRIKNQKRRKSFEECATTDDPVTVFAAANPVTLSSSAPISNSFIHFAANPSVKPVSMLKDHILSPSSSTSSIFDLPGSGEQIPANVLSRDYNKFLCQESLELKPGDLDPNRDVYEFLPMEDFDWDCNAASIVGHHLESYVDIFDAYFKEAMDADAEDYSLFSNTPEPCRQSSCPSSGDNNDYDQRCDRSLRDFGSETRSVSIQSNGGARSVKEAAWYYSLRLLNIQKDDFRYTAIKDLLDKPTRRYLKRICTLPHMVSATDWAGVQGMKGDEKCRLGLLACQARFFGEVLWGIRGVDLYLG